MYWFRIDFNYATKQVMNMACEYSCSYIHYDDFGLFYLPRAIVDGVEVPQILAPLNLHMAKYEKLGNDVAEKQVVCMLRQNRACKCKNLYFLPT